MHLNTCLYSSLSTQSLIIIFYLYYQLVIHLILFKIINRLSTQFIFTLQISYRIAEFWFIIKNSIIIILMLQTINQPIQALADHFGLPLDILKTVLILFVNMPLGAIFILLKAPLQRSLYSLMIGIIELVFLLGHESTYVFAAAIVTYAMIKIIPKAPFLTSVICSSVALTLVHSHRFFFDFSSWKVDCSVYMMFLVTKMTYFGFAVSKNNKQQNFLNYFSYCLFFPSILCGPTFSFERYMDFINFRNEYKNIKFSPENTIKSFIMGLIVSVITAVTLPVFNHQWILKDEGYQNYPLWGKLIAINIIGFFYRVKFYVAWYFAQVTVNLSGLSYSQNGLNDSVVTGSIMFQIEPNPKNKTQYWNSSIQTWLKIIVYDNIAKSFKNQTFAVFGTFLVSAFWHGIYLTYYIGFIQWGILVQLTKFFYKMSFYLPQKFRESIIATVLVYIFGAVTMNYIGMACVLLEWDNMIAFYKQLYYCISIIMVLCFTFSMVVKPPRQDKLKRSNVQTSGQNKKNQ